MLFSVFLLWQVGAVASNGYEREDEDPYHSQQMREDLDEPRERGHRHNEYQPERAEVDASGGFNMQQSDLPQPAMYSNNAESWSFIEHQHRAETAAKAEERSRAKARVTNSGNGAGGERGGGAPSEGWVPCGHLGDDCVCPGGEVRFGVKKQDLWTFPVKIGSKESIKCTIEDVRNARVHVKDTAGAQAARSCQCAERAIKISAVVSSSTSSFIERDSGMRREEERREREDPAGLYEGGGDVEVCLSVPHHASLMQMEQGFENAAMKMLHFDLATEVEHTLCSDGTASPAAAVKEEGQFWTYLLSTGQIRNSQSGKCLGSFFEHDVAHLRAQDCVYLESQCMTQRWEMDFYQTPGFEGGSGLIKLAYGAHTADPYCLAPGDLDFGPSIAPCGMHNSPNSFHWKVTVPSDLTHEWNTCAQDGANCACTGEIRYGESENNNWASAVPVPNKLQISEQVKCDHNDLKEIIINDPVTIPDIEEPDARDCQCKPGPDTPTLTNVDAGSESKSDGSMPIIIGGSVAGALLLAGAAYKMSTKKDGDGLLDGEEEEEWEEGEEYEEEE